MADVYDWSAGGMYSYDVGQQIASPDSGGAPVDWNNIFNKSLDIVGAATQARTTTAPARTGDQTPPPNNAPIRTSGGITIDTNILLILGAVALYALLK